MKKNIRLGYLVIFLFEAYFWFAPWLLFLFQYITISQAAILQAIGLVVATIAEVPTGAISDLLGKKKTLLIAATLTAIGEIWFSFSSTFPAFVVTWVFMNLGYSFFSGTMEAFMYDTLVGEDQEHTYPKVVSHIQAASNAAIGIASIVGGYLFIVWGALPFLATGIFKILSFGVMLFLEEPKVDTDTFSWPNFISQTKKGIRHLITPHMVWATALILLFGSFLTIAWEFLDDVSVVDWGYNSVQIGYLYAVATTLAIPTSYLYPWLSKHFSAMKLIFIAALLLVALYTFSPWINVYIWTTLFLIGAAYSSIRESAISELVNINTPSKIRATTLSTVELFKKIPYVLLSGLIGMIMEERGVRIFASYFGFSLLFALFLYVSASWLNKREPNK